MAPAALWLGAALSLAAVAAGAASAGDDDTFAADHPCTLEACPVCLPEKKRMVRPLDFRVDLWHEQKPFRVGRATNGWDTQSIFSQIIGILTEERLGIDVDYVPCDHEASCFLAVSNFVGWMLSSPLPDTVVTNSSISEAAFKKGLKRFPDPLPDVMFTPEVYRQDRIVATQVLAEKAMAGTSVAMKVYNRGIAVGPSGYVTGAALYTYATFIDDIWAREHFDLSSFRSFTTGRAPEFYTTPEEFIRDGVRPEVEGCSSDDETVAAHMASLRQMGWACRDSWWLTPACARQQENWTTQCVVTLVDTWIYPKMELFRGLARSDMRLAIFTIGKREQADVKMLASQRYNLTFVWWAPSAELVPLKPQRITLPAEFDTNYHVAMKAAWQPTLKANEHLQYLLESAAVTSEQMRWLMREVASELDAGQPFSPAVLQKISCQWLRENRDVWSMWLPTAASCKLGEVFDVHQAICIPCPQGSFWTTEQGKPMCSNCPHGTFAAAAGSMTCTACPEGMIATEDGRSCGCPKGQQAHDGQCKLCPSGSFNEDVSGTCTPCSASLRRSFGEMIFVSEPGSTKTSECRACVLLIGTDSCVSSPAAFATLVSVLIIAIIVISYIRRHKYLDSVWKIDAKELDFGAGEEPEILGRGTFGLVIKAEYRGTMVAVKRVLPPSSSNVSKLWRLQPTPRRRQRTISTQSSQESEGSQHQGSSGSNGTVTGQSQGQGLSLEPARSGTRRAFDRAWTHGTRSGSEDLEWGFYQTMAPGSLISQDAPKKSRCCPRSKGISRAQLEADFILEMRVLSKLRHPCITTVMGAVLGGGEQMLVMELMDHGSLYDLLHNETIILEGELTLPILKDVVQGMRFLHAATPAIVHGDLKAQNVLVDSKFRAKVSDFGLTQKFKVRHCGTPRWMAPEVLRGSRPTTASDVYAFGVLLVEVVSRKEPYEGQDTLQVLVAVADSTQDKRPDIPERCCPALATTMRDCWCGNPELRPDFNELERRLRALRPDGIGQVQVLGCGMQEMRRLTSVTSNPHGGGPRGDQALLYDVFPKHVADALSAGQKVEPEHKDIVTIFFSDIVGFTDISSTLAPEKVSLMLDRLYRKFDTLSYHHSVFKVETIGDAYMAVTNLVEDQAEDHAARIARFAAGAIAAAQETLVDEEDPSRGYVNIRVGFHSGPVVANVVGTRNLRYCLFGDTVNTASRMESSSIQNMIHCSRRSADILMQQDGDIELFPRGVIKVKGKGEMETFWVFRPPATVQPSDSQVTPSASPSWPSPQHIVSLLSQRGRMPTYDDGEKSPSPVGPPAGDRQPALLATAVCSSRLEL